MSQYYYTKTHECFSVDGDIATLSITPHAVDQLGEITYVELPKVGTELAAKASFGEIESVKTVSELYAPVSGTVTEINTALDSEPERVNDDPLTQGWMIKLKMSQPEELKECLSEADYQAYLDASA
jgi:glycine cleavage system H protein